MDILYGIGLIKK